MNKCLGLILLLLLADAWSWQRQKFPFQRLEIPTAVGMAHLSRDGNGHSYFQKPGCSMRFGHRGRGLRLVSPLEGLCCLEVQFWSPSHGHIRLHVSGPCRGGNIFLKKEFSLHPGFNSLTVDMRLRLGDRLFLEADHSGIFSKPLLYLLLPAAERQNIFLISVDNLRADHLELYGYQRSTAPAIAAFCKQAVLFRWAFANSPWTLPSHMSLFTSLYETEHNVTFRVQNEAATAVGKSKPVIKAFPLRREKEFLVERLSRFSIACGFSGGINVAAPFGFYRGFDLYEEAPNDHLNRDSAARLFKRVERHLLQCRFPAAPTMSGRSLLGELRSGLPGPQPVFSANLACRSWSRIPAQAALVQEGYKLVRQFPQGKVSPDFFVIPPPIFPALQLFHLAKDPGEKRELAAEFPQLTARMNTRLQGFLDVRTALSTERFQVLPEETLKILQSLGYIR